MMAEQPGCTPEHFPVARGAATHNRPSTYGTPVEGSKTEQRGRKAHERLSKEILELCEIIGEVGWARRARRET